MDHSVEYEFVEDGENDQGKEKVTQEGAASQVEQDAEYHSYPEAWFFKDGGGRCFAIIFRMVHEVHGEYRVHDKCHDQGGCQRKDQHRRQVDHELADNTRPEEQWEEGSQRGERTGEHRDEHFACGHHGRTGRVYFPLTLRENTVCVLDDYDGVIHDDT